MSVSNLGIDPIPVPSRSIGREVHLSEQIKRAQETLPAVCPPTLHSLSTFVRHRGRASERAKKREETTTTMTMYIFCFLLFKFHPLPFFSYHFVPFHTIAMNHFHLLLFYERHNVICCRPADRPPVCLSVCPLPSLPLAYILYIPRPLSTLRKRKRRKHTHKDTHTSSGRRTIQSKC